MSEKSTRAKRLNGGSVGHTTSAPRTRTHTTEPVVVILISYQDETNYGILCVVSNDRRNAWQDRER